MKKLLFVLICFPVLVYGQNAVILEDFNLKKELPKISEQVPSSVKDWIDPDQLFEGGLECFAKRHLSYAHTGAKFAASFMPLWDDKKNGVIDLLKSPENLMESLNSLKKAFFADKSFWKPVYDLAIPHYKRQFQRMSFAEAKDIMEHLKQGLRYAKNFELSKELKDFSTSNQQFAYDKGKLNAFIFRRISNKEMTKEEVCQWLGKIIEDLTSVMPEKQAGWSNYIIMQGMFWKIENQYFLGYEYSVPLNLEERKHMIFKKEGDRYVPLGSLGDNFIYEKLLSYNDCYFIRLKKTDGKERLYRFRRKEEDLKIIDLQKPVESIKKLAEFKVLEVTYKDGTVDLIYNLDQKEVALYSIKKKPLNIIDYKQNKERFVFYKEGKAELIQFTRKEDNSVNLEVLDLPESIKNIKKIGPPQSYDPFFDEDWGYPSAYTSYSYLLEGEIENYLWIYHNEKKSWDRLRLGTRIYDEAYILNENCYRVGLNGLYAIIDKQGKELLPAKYIEIRAIKENFIVVIDGEIPKAAFFDKHGTALTGFDFEVPINSIFDPITFEEYMGPELHIDEEGGTVIFEKKEGGKDIIVRQMVYDHNAQLIIPPKYDTLQKIYTDSSDLSYYLVMKSMDKSNTKNLQRAKCGVINSLGERVLPVKYQSIEMIYNLWVEDPVFSEPILKDLQPHFLVVDRKGRTIFCDLRGKKIKNPSEGIENVHKPELFGDE
jgi:hypothetical protein